MLPLALSRETKMLLNKSQILSGDRLVISTIFLALSAVIFFAAYILFSSPKHEPNFSEKQKKDFAACKVFAEHKGFNAERKGATMVVSTPVFDEPKFLFSTVESVILACPNMKLKEFCMGFKPDCQEDGVSFMFSYGAPNAY